MIFSLDSPVSRLNDLSKKDADRVQINEFTFNPRLKTASFEYLTGYRTADTIIWTGSSRVFQLLGADYDEVVGLTTYKYSDREREQIQCRMYEWLFSRGRVPTARKGDRPFRVAGNTADEIRYSNLQSGLQGNTIQEALDELENEIDVLQTAGGQGVAKVEDDIQARSYSPLINDTLLYVSSTNLLYSYRSTSTRDDNGLSVIKPFAREVNEPGRWLSIDAGEPSPTTLMIEGTGNPNGSVEAVKGMTYLDTACDILYKQVQVPRGTRWLVL